MEEKIRSEYTTQADQFAYQMEEDLEGVARLSLAPVESVIQSHLPSFHFSAVVIIIDHLRIPIGSPPEKAFSLVRMVQVSDLVHPTKRLAVAFEIFFPPLHDAAKERRNRFLIASASVGIALYPLDGEDIDSLLKNADVVMYNAKDTGKNNYQYYRQSMNVAAIAKAIIAMAHSLKLTVVAEGVETGQQLKFLSDEGCDKMQGYLISQPLPAGEVVKFLARGYSKVR